MIMTEAEKSHTIQLCETFEDLEKAFDLIGNVHGSSRTYEPAHLKAKLNFIRALITEQGYMSFPLNVLTRTYGIRAKAMELAW